MKKRSDRAEKITLGDGYSVEALGIGTIELNVSVPGRNNKEMQTV